MTRVALSMLAALGVAASGCAEPDDTVFTRPPVAPIEIAPGLFRATWNPAPDVVRGFTPDGTRIVYQSRDLPGFRRGWAVLSVGLADGAVREEASVYRTALPDTVGHLAIGSVARLLVTWRAVPEGDVTCVGCPPPPTAVTLALLRLPPADTVPLSALAPRVITLPNNASNGCQHRIRIGPAEQELRDRRVNPFGPVELADGTGGYYSDGEAIWRYDPANPTATPDSIGPGAFPALSPDGQRLAAAVPLGLDSTSGFCVFGLCPCEQETVTITTTGWQVVLYDLATAAGSPLAPGVEPTFDPLAARLAVRRGDGLYWVDLQTGDAALIPRTDNGYSPAVAPDGSVLAFTAESSGNPDVYFVRLR